MRPIRFQCVGVWISSAHHFMFDHTYTRFLLALYVLERKYWVYRGLCLYVRLIAYYTEWPKKMYPLFTHQYLWNKFK